MSQRGRPGLLVSVRSAAEAELALAGGADLIDVKEPRNGALGAAEPAVWGEVLRTVAGRVPVSAALGELLDEDVCELAAQARGLAFAKLGLAGCQKRDGWLRRWFAALDALPRSASAVPVAYADWPAAEAPSPSVALALAAQSRAKTLLLDTFDKRRGNLLEVLSWDSLAEIAAEARRAGVRLVLAGSLDAAAIARLLLLAPAWFGVRGAACRGGRSGTIETALVKSLVRSVMSAGRKAAG